MNIIKKLLFPPICIACDELVEDYGQACPKCWPELDFIGSHACEICDYPFSSALDEEIFESGDKLICLNCKEQKIYYKKAFCLLKYNNLSAKIIRSFKYYDNFSDIDNYAKMLTNKIKEELDLKDFLIIPVPLHKKKLKKRKYNQASIIAKEIAKNTEAKFIPDFLIRNRNTEAQIKLSKNERQNNVKNSFEINQKYFDYIKYNKPENILIVDDVITTGATINECAKTLKKAKIPNINIAAIARRTIEVSN